MGALEALARRVAALPGRKNLVWITGGIPFSLGLGLRSMQNSMSRRKIAEKPSAMNPTASQPDYGRMSSESDLMYIEYPAATKRLFTLEAERAARALDAAGVAVYPVDSVGLLGNTGIDAKDRKSLSFERRSQLGGATLPEDFYANRDAMKFLADRTGGKAFLDSNDLSGSVRTAVDDGRLTYVISYYPNHDKRDGHFQKLKVR